MRREAIPVFDQYAERYDGWFLKNQNVLMSEVLLIRYFLTKYPPGRALSVGCGSGLFEYILRAQFGIEILECVEPAEGMAEIARKRGLNVRIGVAEDLPYPSNTFDTVLFNGVIHYVRDELKALSEIHRVLRPGGQLIMAWVAGEGSYGLLYKLADTLNTWDDEFLRKVAPENPYPLEFIKTARWPTVEEVRNLLERVGFRDLEFAQTLTRHPRYSNDAVEEPLPGFDRGDYIAVRAVKPTQ